MPESDLHEIVKHQSFEGISRGDKVKITGRDDRFNGMTFTFHDYVINTRSGAEWIDLWGGTKSHEQFVSVKTDQIVRI